MSFLRLYLWNSRYYKQTSRYFDQHADVQLTSGQNCYEAVDRYIRDYEIVKVVRNATADIDKISQITRLSKRVILQYLDLIPQHQLQTMDANIANSTPIDETTRKGEEQ